MYSVKSLNSLKLRFNKVYKPLKNNLNGLGNDGIKENFSTIPPLSLYGSSKIICENMIHEYCDLKKLPFVVNRCGLIAGSGQLYTDVQGIVSYWINSWKKNKNAPYEETTKYEEPKVKFKETRIQENFSFDKKLVGLNEKTFKFKLPSLDFLKKPTKKEREKSEKQDVDETFLEKNEKRIIIVCI